ncbi:MAG: cupin domain-containing protein, partial [Pirellulaceae bacterium]|jgi:hypothetical protein|nr:cupin domain-containing protein [Pirellulaceae bacterium]
MNAGEVARRIAELRLQPHPEGGYYCETYRSAERVPAAALPPRYGGDRCLGTAILYLLPAGEVSRLHRVRSDELWHFHEGAALWLHRLDADQGLVSVKLGLHADRGERPQLCVPAGTWFAAEAAADGAYGLVGCTVAPGFEFADFELAERDALTAEYPAYAEFIRRFTPGR